MDNVVYLKNMATREMVSKLQTLLVNTVVRNKHKTMSSIREQVSQHFEDSYPNIDQCRYSCKELGIKKVGEFYEYIPVRDEDKFRDCYRCKNNKSLKDFRKVYQHAFGDIGFDNRLVICNFCIEEEESITGESKAELIGIYAMTQKDYKNVLDEDMYNRFWEKALYG